MITEKAIKNLEKKIKDINKYFLWLDESLKDHKDYCDDKYKYNFFCHEIIELKKIKDKEMVFKIEELEKEDLRKIHDILNDLWRKEYHLLKEIEREVIKVKLKHINKIKNFFVLKRIKDIKNITVDSFCIYYDEDDGYSYILFEVFIKNEKYYFRMDDIFLNDKLEIFYLFDVNTDIKVKSLKEDIQDKVKKFFYKMYINDEFE